MRYIDLYLYHNPDELLCIKTTTNILARQYDDNSTTIRLVSNEQIDIESAQLVALTGGHEYCYNLSSDNEWELSITSELTSEVEVKFTLLVTDPSDQVTTTNTVILRNEPNLMSKPAEVDPQVVAKLVKSAIVSMRYNSLLSRYEFLNLDGEVRFHISRSFI